MWKPPALNRLIAHHLSRHPAMEPRDVYKLLYQGVLGPEHLIRSPEDFASRLRAEYETVPAEEDDPLWEPVRPDGTLGRLNLRPFKAQKGELDWLIAACLRTAERAWGTKAELRAVWAAFVEQCRNGEWDVFPLPEVLAFSAWLEEHDYPPAHHSPGYRKANRPAYRLLAHELLTGPDGNRRARWQLALQ